MWLHACHHMKSLHLLDIVITSVSVLLYKRPVSWSCNQHWAVSLHNLNCHYRAVILWSKLRVEVFTVVLFSLWLCSYSELFVFPLHIRWLLLELDFPPSGRLCESGPSRDCNDVVRTPLGIDCHPELARHRVWF